MMILVMTNAPMNNLRCVCSDVATALDYLRKIAGEPLRARSFGFGPESYFVYEDEEPEKWDEHVVPNAYDWQYVLPKDTYYLKPIDFIG